jgi:hypothetical protein
MLFQQLLHGKAFRFISMAKSKKLVSNFVFKRPVRKIGNHFDN